MGFLEEQIASRGNAFASGGPTVLGAPVGQRSGTDESGLGQMVELMQLFVQGQREFRDEIADWQRNLEVSLDLVKTKKGLEVVEKTQKGGGIR